MCEESATVCEAVFRTSGSTCDTHCQSLGLSCERAWDNDAGVDDGGCASKVTDDFRRIGNGCGMIYVDQICRCSTDSG